MTSDNPKSQALPRPAAGVPVDFDPLPSAEPLDPPLAPTLLEGKCVVLCVTGSIAAYKAILLSRLLLGQGARVKVVLTQAAQRFVQASTFSALTGEPVLSGLFGHAGEPHVELARSADCILVVPATADALARLAHGHANDLMSALVLAAQCPVLLAPAMHPSMWTHPRTEHNVALLKSAANVHFAGPVSGEVASGEVGLGRMAEPEAILEAVYQCLGPRDLAGRHIVVSAGPTREALDPVRFLSNRSSGKMGFALAARAARRGARVTLVSGPVDLATPLGVERCDVETALEMQSALDAALGHDLSLADALIMSAAVADYRCRAPSSDKLHRSNGPLTLEFEPNPDLLASIGTRRTGKSPVLVGFALELKQGSALIPLARQKLIAKRVDLIVANGSESLEADTSRALLVGVRDCKDPGTLEKSRLADHILDWIQSKLTEVESDEATE